MTDVETWIRQWRGILSLLAIVLTAAAWGLTLRADVTALQRDLTRLDTAGSTPMRSMVRRIENIEQNVARTDSAVREIRQFLCGSRPLCTR